MKSVVLTRRLHDAHLAFSSAGVAEDAAEDEDDVAVLREGDFERDEERERKDIVDWELKRKKKRKKMFDFSSFFRFPLSHLTHSQTGLLNPKRK